MRKAEIAVWAIITFALGWGLFAVVMPFYNRENNIGAMGRAYRFLLIPIVVQVIWFAGGAMYSTWRKRREAIVGILLGFALEIAAIVILILISASAHY